MWDRKIDILGTKVHVGQFNLEDDFNLPRWLIFRQPMWGDGPGTYFLQAMFQGTLAMTMEPKFIVRQQAEGDEFNVWTVIELAWDASLREDGPHVVDIIVYSNDGSSVDSYQRRREAQRLARQAKEMAHGA
jgi:hypothetical protein